MPTSVVNPRIILIVGLIFHDERVYEENIFYKTNLRIKVNCIFLHKIKQQDFDKPNVSDNQTILQRESSTYGIFPFFCFKITSAKVT